MQEKYTVILVVMFLLTLGTAGLVLLLFRQRKTRSQKIISILAEQMGGTLEQTTITGVLDNTSYCLEFTNPAQIPLFAVLSLPCKCMTRMTIRKRGLLDRLGGGIGLLNQIRSGFPDFDKRFMVNSSDPSMAARYLSDSGKVKKISELLSIMPGTLTFEPNYVSIHYIIHRQSGIEIESFTSKNLSKIISLLAGFQNIADTDIDQVPHVPPIPQPPYDRRVMMIFMMLFTFSTMASVMGMVMVMHHYRPLSSAAMMAAGMRFAMAPAIIGTTGLMGAAYFALRGKNEAHKLFLMISITIPIALFLAIIIYFMFTNGSMDQSPGQVHTAMVVEKSIRKGKNTSYTLIVQSWRDDDKRIRLKVSPDMYEDIKANDMVALTTKPGYRGFEWIAVPPAIMNQ